MRRTQSPSRMKEAPTATYGLLHHSTCVGPTMSIVVLAFACTCVVAPASGAASNPPPLSLPSSSSSPPNQLPTYTKDQSKENAANSGALAS